jgi:hypothetical protein
MVYRFHYSVPRPPPPPRSYRPRVRGIRRMLRATHNMRCTPRIHNGVARCSDAKLVLKIERNWPRPAEGIARGTNAVGEKQVRRRWTWTEINCFSRALNRFTACCARVHDFIRVSKRRSEIYRAPDSLLNPSKKNERERRKRCTFFVRRKRSRVCK